MLNLMFWRHHATNNPSGNIHGPARASARSLNQIQPGRTVKIAGYGQINAEQKQHLQAYGLLAGRAIQVLAQKPVTIVLIEQTELAFEEELSRQVLIDSYC